jgi:hypothetical protein
MKERDPIFAAIRAFGPFCVMGWLGVTLVAIPSASQAQDGYAVDSKDECFITGGERCHHAMAYDNDRKVTVFFGGEIGETGNEEYFNDTQEYDGVQWKQISVLSDTKPSHRSFHTMAYNPITKRVMLYGGYTGGKFCAR